MFFYDLYAWKSTIDIEEINYIDIYRFLVILLFV